MKKFLLVVAGLVFAHAVFSDPRLSAVLAVLVVPLEAWIIVRAWPALRADVRSVLGHTPRFGRRRRVVGGF